MTTPNVILNNGVAIPQVGFGVYKVPDAETTEAVSTALELGYRSIDTAALYGNEAGVGAALAASSLERSDVFVTSKVWNTEHGYDRTLRAFDHSLELLGIDQIDLFLIHWPCPAQDLYRETWRALERIYADGRARAIGVSNFTPEHLTRLLDSAEIVPAINQIELHPALPQHESVEFHRAHGIATEAWSPLARGHGLADPQIIEIAERLGKSPAQVILRWHLQQGRIVIPKSVTPARIAENIALNDFELSPADIAHIDTLGREDGRVGSHPDRVEP
ncbi:aldo/keto reductase [Mycetocola tolaasinivorans]|uniref:Aldo/keto reductase n=1 Tax=Mycetocola tolaasinivorans TaxID=76635 RepID=A0A3L7ABE4_9MICO|nr:aldo/keto reductase [Mycetocola tolaasinivorans]RLP77547.1 aldo/keto reductase [Mycetocola tolaasinivorans]